MTQPRQISFHPQHHPKNVTREQPSRNSPSIYTAPFDSEPASAPTNYSSVSKPSIQTEPSKSRALFLNPKPQKPHPSKLASLSMPYPEKEERHQSQSKLEQLQQKIAVLRRTVSQNKNINESRVNSLTTKVQKLRDKYVQKERKLASLVKSIHQQFP